MTSQRCQAINAMLLPLFALTLIVPFTKSVDMEVGILSLYTGVVAIFHLHYGIVLVSRNCHSLVIKTGRSKALRMFHCPLKDVLASGKISFLDDSK